MLKVTMPRLKIEWDKAIKFFKERDAYRIQLRGWIKKHGLANLPEVVLRTVPVDMKVLYEIKWWLQPIVWVRIIQMSVLNAQNEGVRRIQNG